MTARRRMLPVVVAIGLLTTACGGPGGGAATTNDGACAAVLPLARSIVHDQGTPVLIRRINGADADRLSRAVGAAPPPAHPPPGQPPSPGQPPPGQPPSPGQPPGQPPSPGQPPGHPAPSGRPEPGRAQPSERPRPPSSGKPAAPKTCLVVYHGHYPPGTIAGATPPATAGDYALMVLRVRRPGIDRVLVAPTLPADTVHRSWWQRLIS